MAVSSKAAQEYLNGPLVAPEPSEETGLNSSFVMPKEPLSPTSTGASTNPYRRSSVNTNNGLKTHSRQTSREISGGGHSRQTSRDFGNGSSPRTTKFPNYREEMLGGLNEGPSRRSMDNPPAYDGQTRPRRGSSLKERFPGDDSNRPLDILRRDSKKAQRSPHLTKRQLPGADSIDRLDPTINKIPYHHEGPYDAASLARNTNSRTAPIAALEESNREALKATAPENVKDALNKHMPLDGVAAVPPGVPDQMGRVYEYQEGENQMFEGQPEGGQYKRYEGVEYDDNDVHGQGEPSYSLDRALRNHTIHERNFDGQRGIELSDRPLMNDYDKRNGKKVDTRDPVAIAGDDGRYADLQHAADVDAHPPRRQGSLKEGLKRRIGSLRKKGLDEYLP